MKEDIQGAHLHRAREQQVPDDYGLVNLTCRNGPKHLFFEVMAAINIHLDAWVKTSGPGAAEPTAA